MTRDELLELITEIQECKSELPNVDAKAARGGTPKRLFESLSGFSNHVGGGVIVLGLDESRGFEVVGVGNAQRIQEDVSSVANSEMEPALRPEFTVEQIEGKTVVAVEVPEVSPTQKPCYYKPASLQKGSYIRVGNTNRQMTDYEIFGYVSNRQQPAFDEEVVEEARMDDLDRVKLDDYIDRLKQVRPGASYLNQPVERALTQLRIVRKSNGGLKPTLAGLLMFGRFPQEFEPQIVVTFLQYYGTTETEPTPRGERFLDNRKFEGPIPEMVEATVNHVLASIRKSSLIEGLWRRDIPEYPVEALREAIVNAVAHRDYSKFVRGNYIQIRLFADRIEIQSPGGLYGNVTEENLEEEQSTRNRILVRLMEDCRLVENRGSGIRTMLGVMREANLEPPKFEDKRSSFWVTFRNHTLMGPAQVEWLNQFADVALNDHQRFALVYMRTNQQMTNGDYTRLNHVDRVVAYQELRGLAQTGLVKPVGARGGAYYRLNVPVEPHVAPQPQTDESKILAYVRERGSIGNSECRELLGVEIQRASHILKSMRKRGQLTRKGEHRWARYYSP